MEKLPTQTQQPQQRTAPSLTAAAAAETSVRGGRRIVMVGGEDAVRTSGQSTANPTSSSNNTTEAAQSSCLLTTSALASGGKTSSSQTALSSNVAAVAGAALYQPPIPQILPTFKAASPIVEATVTKPSLDAGVAAAEVSAAVVPAKSLPTAVFATAIAKALSQSATATETRDATVSDTASATTTPNPTVAGSIQQSDVNAKSAARQATNTTSGTVAARSTTSSSKSPPHVGFVDLADCDFDSLDAADTTMNANMAATTTGRRVPNGIRAPWSAHVSPHARRRIDVLDSLALAAFDCNDSSTKPNASSAAPTTTQTAPPTECTRPSPPANISTRKDPPSNQSPMHHKKGLVTIQTNTTVAAAATATATASTFQHEVNLDNEHGGDDEKDNVAVVIQVQSTKVTVTVNASGPHVKVVDTNDPSSDNIPIFEETLVRKSTLRKRPLLTNGDFPSTAAAAAAAASPDANHENAVDSAKRQKTAAAAAAAESTAVAQPLQLWKTPKPHAQPPVNSKLLVNCSDSSHGDDADRDDGMDNLPGTALYHATLEHFRPAFASSSTSIEKEAIVQHFLDCFMFQKAVVSVDTIQEDGTSTTYTDWLVLGAHSARTMLYEALSQPLSLIRESAARRSRSKKAAKTAAGCAKTSAAGRTKRLLATTTVPDGMSSCSDDSQNGDCNSDYTNFAPSGFAASTATIAAASTPRLPVIYCYKGSQFSKQAANVAFVELIQSHILEYQNASKARQRSIVRDMAERFEFVVGPNSNGPWKSTTEEWTKLKIHKSLTRTIPPENAFSTPKSSRQLSSPQKSSTNATRENSSMPKTAETTTLSENAATVASAPTKALSMETLNRIAATTGKLVVYCGNLGPGHGKSEEPGNVAYVERTRATCREYCSTSNATTKKAILDAILDEFHFYRPINSNMSLWTMTDGEWARRKVSRRLALLGNENAANDSSMDTNV